MTEETATATQEATGGPIPGPETAPPAAIFDPNETILVDVDGQIIPLPANLCQDRETLKKVLAPWYPEIANAEISDIVVTGGTKKITVTKKAGPKGVSPFGEALIAAPERKNPALAVYEEIRDQDLASLSAEEMLAMNTRIGTAIEDGEKQAGQIDWARKRLIRSAPRPAPQVILGF